MVGCPPPPPLGQTIDRYIRRKVAFSSLEFPSFKTSFFAQTLSEVKARSFSFMKASQNIHQFPAEVMPFEIFGGAKLVSVHYRENLDFTPAGIRVAFDDRRTQQECLSGR